MITFTQVGNTQKVIDSRDVIARIQELREQFTEALEEWIDKPTVDLIFDKDEIEEYAQLKRLSDQCEDLVGWEDGETLIRGSYFRQYLRDEFYPSEPDEDEIEADYREVKFGKVIYMIRDF